ncbi:hypothetical protein H0H93_002361 [Arthromyces matolae]|nr:hypothetical protein H0H93_002361 [Arthromyces matolae]
MEAAVSPRSVPLPLSPPALQIDEVLESNSLIPTPGDESCAAQPLTPQPHEEHTENSEALDSNDSKGLNITITDVKKIEETAENLVARGEPDQSPIPAQESSERSSLEREEGRAITEHQPNVADAENHDRAHSTIPTQDTVPKSPQPAEATVEQETEITHNEDNTAAPPTPPAKPKGVREDTVVSGTSHADESAQGHKRSFTISRGYTVSVVLITAALETIAASREAKRSTSLRDSTQKALELIRNDQGGGHPREIFEPLRLACETKNEKLMIASLDCISKLISYSFFAEPDAEPSHIPSPPPSPHQPGSGASAPQPSLVDLVAHTIASCHLETTPESVSLQIVKALLSLVLSPTILVHHSSLLKAVRTVYNVYLLSTDPVNQGVAQGGLTQMVQHIFARCKVSRTSKETSELALPSSALPLSTPSSNRASFAISRPDSDVIGHEGDDETAPPSEEDAPQKLSSLNGNDGPSANGNARLTLQNFETVNPLDIVPEADHGHHLTSNDLFVKDAFLVFRALCKLTMKPLNTESERDVKSHAMRSKLLSLHLVLTVLNSHMALFVDPKAIIYSSSSNEATTFVQAVTQYLCLSLSRNVVSPVPQVFEISVEIFWRVLSGMRTKLKKEIEVLLHEIFIPILEMRTSTLKQKAVILGMLSRLCQDPQALVEIYLNYDCDSEAVDNIYEHLINIVSKIGTTPSSSNHQRSSEPSSPALSPTNKSQAAGTPPSITSVLSVPGTMDTSVMGLSEGQLKRQGLECLVAVMRSLVVWGTASGKAVDEVPATPAKSQVGEDLPLTPDGSVDKLSASATSTDTLRQPTPDIVDDPTRFESAKQKKTTLLEGIKKFNFKPKRGVQFLVETGFIPSNSSLDIAKFLLSTDGLSKSMIGEYLGEGADQNIEIMHAFVDQLEFKDLPFVDALRMFLQSFRLPGEAQKIDRFMLKFAERYIAGNAKTVFANADTAYVLAYSTIMLNTDAHNPQIKHRMSKAEFIRNNRGINDNNDLPEEFLSSVYDEIVLNEIKMKDEVESTLTVHAGGPGLAGALANVGRDLQKEAYVLQSNGMAIKTEALFRTMMRSQRKTSKEYFSASHFVHVRPMFEVAWMAFLAGLSGPLQETDDLEVVELCLDGFKNAIRIVCFFDLELQRNAFVTTLAKFTFLNNLGEMKTKNMEAIKTLLDVAVTEGNNLKGSWHEVLTCVSQLEHMQLISGGADAQDGRKSRARKLPSEELANESRSTHITVAADMVFSLSHYLSGTAIVDFVQALSDVSWEEIQSSASSNVQSAKIGRDLILQHEQDSLGVVCCHNNPHVAFFALDALRQLAMRFLEKEELPHFKFQKDFLKPFEYTMIHNHNPDVRDMVLQCLQQMIQARVQNMRSGWRTMFGVFSAASKVLTERIASSAFEIVTRLNKEHFPDIVRHGAFADLTVCITEFCKVSKYQKISLLAIAMLRGVIPVMLKCPDCSLTVTADDNTGPMDDAMIKFWFPTLFGFYDIIMNGEDLEVRRLALDSLFSTLKTYGSAYPVEFWDTVCQELLFPIFAVLKSSHDLSRFSTQEDMSVWLSTTMIQALRDLIDLYTFYFEILERFLDGLLDLLCVCICQENDTLARIGTSCFQQLLENNVAKLSSARWERVTTTFVKLFRTTTPHQLFDDNLRVEIDDSMGEVGEGADYNGQTILPAPLSPNSEQPKADARSSLTERRRIFKQIIVKCVLQLLLIETTNDLLRNNSVYSTIPPDQLLRLMGVLDHSYQFARMFNDDKELRTGLWKVGFMKHLPNLLKQESSSAATLVHILLQMYYDPRPAHQAAQPQIAERLLPLGLGVLQDFNKLRPDTQSKNITAWTPVVTEILEGFCRFDDKAFSRYLPAIYPLATDLLSRDVSSEIRQSLRTYFLRVGYAQGMIEASS